MRVPYRLTSGAALSALALTLVASFVPRAPRAAGFDPCSIIDDQWNMMPKLPTLVWLGAYVLFSVQGLRNRSGPRWLAIAGLLAGVLSSLVEVSKHIRFGCYTKDGLVLSLMWFGFAMIMFLHHAVRPRKRGAAQDGLTES